MATFTLFITVPSLFELNPRYYLIDFVAVLVGAVTGLCKSCPFPVPTCLDNMYCAKLVLHSRLIIRSPLFLNLDSRRGRDPHDCDVEARNGSECTDGDARPQQ